MGDMARLKEWRRQQESAIVGAIVRGHATKGSALREAHAELAMSQEYYTDQATLARTWTKLERDGRIVRVGRRWEVRDA